MSGLDRSKKYYHILIVSVADSDHLDVVRHPLVSKIAKHITTRSKLLYFLRKSLGAKN